MDPLTHTAIGLFLSRAGLNRLSPRATPILLLAANAPDIDIVTAAGGSLEYLNYHRHLTHSIAMLPVMAALPVLVVRLFSKQAFDWKRSWLISALAVASHLALDSTNVYGIRLGLPFTGHWYRLDLTSVIDVWIWAVMALCVAGPVIGRLVGSEIGAPSRPGRGFAIFALLFLFAYNSARAVLHERAAGMLESRVYSGSPPVRVAAMPGPANPMRWRGVVETREFYGLYDLDLSRGFDPTAGTVLYKPEASPAIDAANRTKPFRDFLAFAQYPIYRVVPNAEPEGSMLVELTDLRFGGGFTASAVVDAHAEVMHSSFTFGRVRPR